MSNKGRDISLMDNDEGEVGVYYSQMNGCSLPDCLLRSKKFSDVLKIMSNSSFQGTEQIRKILKSPNDKPPDCQHGEACRGKKLCGPKTDDDYEYMIEAGYVASFSNNPDGGSIDVCSSCLRKLANRLDQLNDKIEK